MKGVKKVPPLKRRTYVPPENFEQLLEQLRNGNIEGINVTGEGSYPVWKNRLANLDIDDVKASVRGEELYLVLISDGD